jgi:hypothetical protein
MALWGGNRKRKTIAQRWACSCTSVRQGVRRAVGPTLAMLAGFGLVVGGDGAWKIIGDSPHFRLQRTDVTGASTMGREEVMAACGLVPGFTRLMGLDSMDVAATCEADSRIRSARVETMLPDEVRIVIEEQHPELVVATDKGLWLVNSYAEAYAPWDLDQISTLPLLVGSPETSSAVERAPLLRQAVDLLRTVRRDSGPWQDSDLVIEHDPHLGFRVIPVSRGIAARFGGGPFPAKMKRLKFALEAVRPRGLPVAEAFLDDAIRPDRVTLRLGGFGPFAEVERDGTAWRVP